MNQYVTCNEHVTSQDLKDTMNLAKARAYHYQSIGWTMFSREELISAAYEGVSEALIRFQPDKGTVKDTKLSSYAYFWIEKYLKEYITKNKTILNGSTVEMWTGQVPYTNSIDALDTGADDQMGSDHKDWLATDEDAASNIDKQERNQDINDLLATIFLELEPKERLVIQLSLGIGTIQHIQLTNREIARQTNMRVYEVDEILARAYQKVYESKQKYAEQFEELF